MERLTGVPNEHRCCARWGGWARNAGWAIFMNPEPRRGSIRFTIRLVVPRFAPRLLIALPPQVFCGVSYPRGPQMLHDSASALLS